MKTRLELIKQSAEIVEKYGEDTVASLFAKDVENFLHSLHQAPYGTYSEPLVTSTTPTHSHPATVEWSIEEEDKSSTWKAD